MTEKIKEHIQSIPTDTCDTYCYHETVVNRVNERIDEISGVEMLFKALADANRLKVAYALTLEEEMCVCDVANVLETSTANASHHLRYLRDMGLTTYRKEGKLVFYSLVDECVRQLVNIALEHSKEGWHK
ncbi:helix-turn-helix transcriptional regulator [Sporosarcina sp. Marseille-Q4063]|uniref:ArsR/SmtB family transcription factor n=1 Tax=Sporosarcina sp. Marseille-Q4063 TaxID=2810514 RepID=UPI001BAE59CE|nr:metalloregulator ArsR/SmtB family transcription factor [Sporosarcina sp. Marseille-Q4063]QUW20940.1 helix-turn-helix transcriptional regulator [Sporosarcina sp. Marseille-Q4063]